jgi:hypothetical protein
MEILFNSSLFSSSWINDLRFEEGMFQDIL